jgi:hypothetical protein
VKQGERRKSVEVERTATIFSLEEQEDIYSGLAAIYTVEVLYTRGEARQAESEQERSGEKSRSHFLQKR